MNDEWGSTLGRSESQLDAPRGAWGSILSQRNDEKVDPVADLGKFTAKSDTQVKEKNTKEANGWRAIMENGVKFTDPVKNEAGMPPIAKGKFPRQEEPVVGGADIEHEWKIEASAEDETWGVGGGTLILNGQGNNVTVLAGEVTGASGVVYLQITRNPSTRVASAPKFGLAETLPTSTETTQYFRLGVVGGTPNIQQKQFQPISVLEDLFVINGAFMLGNLALFGDNLYTPPVI